MSIQKVMVVDDSPTDMHLLTGLLQKNGFQTISATNGEDAVSMAQSEKPDLILMDVVMPGMNGFEATRAITRNPETSTIPIIVVSSKGQETDKVWGLRQGATDYLVKPVSENTLIEKIRSL